MSSATSFISKGYLWSTFCLRAALSSPISANQKAEGQVSLFSFPLFLSTSLPPSFLYNTRCNPLSSSVSLIFYTSFTLSLYLPNARYEVFPCLLLKPYHKPLSPFYHHPSNTLFIPPGQIYVLPIASPQFPSSCYSSCKTHINGSFLWIIFPDIVQNLQLAQVAWLYIFSPL